MNAIRIGVTATLLLGMATAQAAPPTSDAAEMTRAHAEFGYFTGTWRCDEAWTKTDFNPDYKSGAILQATDNLDGVWLVWSYQQQPSPGVPHPAKGADFWGYDPTTKTFVRTKIDAYLPGKATQLTSTGWNGDTIAWEGETLTPNGPAPFKHTFTKVDGSTIKGALFIAGHQFYSSICKKQPD
jgi:hypothetical protein